MHVIDGGGGGGGLVTVRGDLRRLSPRNRRNSFARTFERKQKRFAPKKAYAGRAISDVPLSPRTRKRLVRTRSVATAARRADETDTSLSLTRVDNAHNNNCSAGKSSNRRLNGITDRIQKTGKSIFS